MPPRILASLRDGNRKQVVVYESGVDFECRLSVLSAPLAAPGDHAADRNLQMSRFRTWAHVERVWIRGRRLFVQLSDEIQWVRFRRRDSEAAETCRRLIEERLIPTEILPVSLDELAAHPERFHNRWVRVEGSVERRFEYSVLHDGTAGSPERRAALARVWVTLGPRRAFRELATGEAVAPDERPPRPGLLRRLRDRLESWDWHRRCCTIDRPEANDGTSLSGLDGVFGPFVLTGVFECDRARGVRYGHMDLCHALLTVRAIAASGSLVARR